MASGDTIYCCVFEIGSERHVVQSYGGIEAFSHGFWLNDEFLLTKGSDAKYWIPPHNILYVEKTKEL